MDQSQVELLHGFVDILKKKPEIIHLPELKFFKEWLQSLGATIPIKTTPKEHTETEPEPAADSGADDSSESAIEFDDSDIIKTENDPPQEMGDDSIDVTEEMIDKANEKQTQAQGKLSEGDIKGAINLFTDSIKLNPHSALLYARRAGCFIQLKKPYAALRDCDQAISLNPDSAKPYKWRGFANRLLGRYECAYSDLQTSLKLDYSEDAYEAMKEVEPKHKRIFEHKMKYDRKREEKLDHDRRERIRKARESRMHTEQESSENGTAGATQNMGDVFSSLFNDPELTAALQDPEVMAAFSEVSTNPDAMAKYKDNPKVMKCLDLMKKKFGGSGGGMPGGMPFGMGNPFAAPSQATPDLD